jgi:hypothetical protein
MNDSIIDLRDEARKHMPQVPALEHLYGSARTTWLARMANEYTSAAVFEGLARQMRDLGLDAALVDECRAFANEERRHGVLCGAVVEALGGTATAPRPHREPYPFHADAQPLEALVRNVLSICCLSETVAVALIGAERLEMEKGSLHDLLTEIYADEVGHARFGWRLIARLVPGMGAEVRDRLTRYLALAFSHLEEHELAHLPVGQRWPAGGEQLGLCDGSDGRVLFYECVDEVIIPGLEATGLDARRAWDCRGTAKAA